MKKEHLLALLICMLLLTFACAPKQPEQLSTQLPVPVGEKEKVQISSIKTVTIQDIVSNINEFVDVKVQITGKLIFSGKNYFTDPRFAITDGKNIFSVSVWAPLEVPPPFESSKGELLPNTMGDYLDKTITVQGMIKKANEQFYLEVIKATIIEQQKVNPKLIIASPNDGDLIKSLKVTVELQAENFKIVPVGQPVNEGEGHFHVWLDSEKIVTVDRIVTFENIVSGKHTITAELVKSDHSSLIPRITKAITINVESDYVPKVEAPQQSINEFTVEADDNGFYPNKLQAKVGDKLKINFKFRDNAIYFAGLDVKGPFPTIQYKLKGEQPLTAEFTMKDETKITSYWPSSGVKKADLIVEVVK